MSLMLFNMDFLETSSICRLCLKINSGCNIQTLEGFNMYMLKLVAPAVNLEVNSVSKICNKCAEKLKSTYDFKSVCLENNGTSQPVFLNEAKPQKDNGSKCCLCDNKDNLKKCKANEILFLNTMLEKCLPELLDMEKISTICQECLKSVVNLFAFLNCCLDTEDKINNYVQVNGLNKKGQVSILDVYHANIIVEEQNTEETKKVENPEEVEDNPDPVDRTDCDGGVDSEAEVKIDVTEITLKMEELSDCEKSAQDVNGKPETSLRCAATDTHKTAAQPSADFSFMAPQTLSQFSTSQPTASNGTQSTLANPYRNMMESEVQCQMAPNPDEYHSETETAAGYCTMPSEQETYSRMQEDDESYFIEDHISDVFIKEEVEDDLFEESDHNREEMCNSVPLEEYNNSVNSVSLNRKRKIRKSTSKGRKRFASENHMARQRRLTNVFGCHECTFKTENKHILARHMIRHKGKSGVEMPHKTKNTKRMLKHQLSRKKSKNMLHQPDEQKSKKEMYKCESCEYETRHKDNVIRHMLKHREPRVEKKFKCDKCAYEADLKHHLHQHNLIHKDISEVEMYKCELCEFETRYKGSMPKHMLRHHDPKAERQFKCDKCAYETHHKSQLRQHSLIHKDKSELEMHMCEICDYEAKYKYYLYRHMVTHRDVKAKGKFKCDQCSYETDHKSRLTVHNLIHKDRSEVKMHKCEKCDFETKYKSSMIRHMEKHRDPDPKAEIF